MASNGWGIPFDAETGFGMGAVNDDGTGYGNVLITSYSGETNISSIDDDNQLVILTEGPTIYVDADNMYVYFRYNPDITVTNVTYTLYLDDSFVADGSLTMDGISWIAEYPVSGRYYLTLKVFTDPDTFYNFTSNILDV